MAKSTDLYLTQNTNNSGITFENSDGTTRQELFTAGANGSRLNSIAATTDDSSPNNVMLEYYDGSNYFLLGTIRVLTLAGTDGAVISQNLLNNIDLPFVQRDNSSNYFIQLETTHKIFVNVLATVTADKTLTVTAFGEDY